MHVVSLREGHERTRLPDPEAMMSNAALQLYTVRDLDEPLPAVIHRVAETGFDGVEFAHRVRQEDPDAIREALDATGVTPVAAHVELHTLEGNEELLDRFETVGIDRVVLPHLPISHFTTLNRLDQLVARLTRLADVLESRRMELVFHNTREVFFPPLDEFSLQWLARFNGMPDIGSFYLSYVFARLSRFDEGDISDRTGFGHLLDRTTSDILTFEVDIKNVSAAGLSPSSVFDLVGDRLSLVHIADITRTRRVPPRYAAVDPGTGIVDIPGCIRAAHESAAEWLVYEHDAPADPLSALEQAASVMEPVMDGGRWPSDTPESVLSAD